MRKILIIILAIQVALLASIGLDSAGLPIFRQLIGFVYLTFVPGFLIMYHLKFSRTSLLNTILYSVGLSLSFIMFVGLFLNVLLPLIGVSQPLSGAPVVVTLTVITLVLTILIYRSNRRLWNAVPSIPNLKVTSVLFLVLVVLISIAGAYQAAVYKSSSLLLVGTAIIALTVLLAAFGKFITRDLLPVAIFAISLALLYQVTLKGPYLSGFSDIHLEYYFYKLALANSYWDATIANNYNAMLSVSILPTMYSVVANIDGLFIFKVIYPLFFSLVPLAVYSAGTRLLDKRGAFLGAFFFVAFHAFYSELPFLFKQGIAEVFLALCLLVMVDRNLTQIQKVALLIIFASTVVVSHYAVTYFLMLSFLFAWLWLRIAKGLKGVLQEGPASHALAQSIEPAPDSGKTTIILTGGFVALFTVVALAWYLYTAGSSPFDAAVRVGQHIYSTGLTEFFNPAVRGRGTVLIGVGLGPPAETWLNQVNRAIFYATEFFIVVGLLVAIVKRKEIDWPLEYLAMVSANMLLLLLCIILPYFSAEFSVVRLFHTTLIFLAPLCVLGGMATFSGIRRVFQRENSQFLNSLSPSRPSSRVGWTYIPVTVILVLYFLFNTSFVFVVAGYTSPLTPLNLTNIERYGSAEEKAVYYSMIGYAFPQDVLSAQWLADRSGPEARIFADVIAQETVLTSTAIPKKIRLITASPTGKGDYIYLRYVNINYDLISLPPAEGAYYEHYEPAKVGELTYLFEQSNKIYANGSSEVWLK